ncbi:MAG: flagellar biosynthesis protein FliQ [Candidatus Saganbacteria bacterium]|nr:flagellar biosynthesis protein FliQ [Candidatus Saganbacteria bacterium]
MTQDFIVQVMYNGITTILLISLPPVGAGLVVGFIISLFQAVTQIQEQTLTFVPKVVVVLLLIAFTSPWIVSMFVDFTIALWGNIPNMVR